MENLVGLPLANVQADVALSRDQRLHPTGVNSLRGARRVLN